MRPTLLIVVFCALTGCGAAETAPFGFGAPGKAEAVLGAKDLWPNGDVYLLDDFELWKLDLRTWEVGVAWQLKMARFELAENTPIRLNFIDAPRADGVFREFKIQAKGGNAFMGTYNLAEAAKAEAHLVRHELGHIIGLHHTHQRVDRDEHILLHEPHIEGDDPARASHNILSKRSHSCHVGPYDSRSIMHYPSYGLAKSAKCASVSLRSSDRPADPAECIGSDDPRWVVIRDRYSDWNYAVISTLYCDKRYCGDNCAPEERCKHPRVVEHLERARAWEQSAEGQAWAARYPQDKCAAPLGQLQPSIPPAPPAPPPRSSWGLSMRVDCGPAITQTGCCTNAALYVCHNGTLHQKTCPAGCGWSAQLGAYDCGGVGADPTGVTPLSCID